MLQRCAKIKPSRGARLPLFESLANVAHERLAMLARQKALPRLFALRHQLRVSRALMIVFVWRVWRLAVGRDHHGPSQKVVTRFSALRQLPARMASVVGCFRSPRSRARWSCNLTIASSRSLRSLGRLIHGRRCAPASHHPCKAAAHARRWTSPATPGNVGGGLDVA